ncbi:MAG: hypothetical protein COA78_12150 [Blastopirellula sp.]|nr:MAG: hypothetical protein COA78_12150 [Blastopirellula sp.]
MSNGKTKAKNKGKQETIKNVRADMESRAAEADDRLDSLEATINELNIDVGTKFSEVLEAIKNQAKNNPVSISKDGADSRDLHKHEDERPNSYLFAEGRPEDDVELIELQLTSSDSSEFKEKAEQMMFDQEKILIRVMPSASTYPDHTFLIGVNGKMIAIMRGHKQRVPRNYVEVLLRCKTSTYGNVETINQYNNELTVINPETKSHRYPLEVLEDKNPLGAKWLERVVNDRAA